MTLTETELPVVADLCDMTAGGWYLWPEGGPALVQRWDEDRYVAVIVFLFTAGVVWGYVREPWTYEDRWCYADVASAAAAAHAWIRDPDAVEPVGWHRHPTSGRRRDHGDPASEYVAI